MKVTLIAPRREQCGVADYSRLLADELRSRVELAWDVDAADFTDAMNDVDLIHVQHQYFLFGGVAPWKNRFAPFLARLKRPVALTVHEFVTPSGGPLARMAIRVANRANFANPRIRRLIVHTDLDRERMTAEGIAAERVTVVRMGVPAPPSLPDRDAARRSLGLEGRFVVTLFGFLSRRKGHKIAIESLARVPGEVYLLLAGGRHPDDLTGYTEDLARHIQENGLAGRARITGYLNSSNMAAVMSATDLVIAPFTESSGSASLAFAFACGKPILASGIAPHREIANEMGPDLHLFDSGDPYALAAGIKTLVDNPRYLVNMAAASQRYAQNHSYARMAGETVDVYRSILAEAAS